jgi:hypothetical protein
VFVWIGLPATMSANDLLPYVLDVLRLTIITDNLDDLRALSSFSSFTVKK